VLIDMTAGDKDPFPCQDPNPDNPAQVCGLDYTHTGPCGSWWEPQTSSNQEGGPFR
jgi:hypothetical protein